MSGSLWSVLGIPPSSDRAAIRRAYAAKLKQTNPEDDADGFKALRAAYDEALAMADARARYAAQDVADDEDEPTDWEDGEAYDDSARAAIFTATPTPDRPPETPTDPIPTPADPATPPAPPAEPPPPKTGLLEGRDRDLAEFEARMNALASQLASPWARDDVALEAAFHAILAAPAMTEITIHAHAGEWIAGLLASNIPKSDALLLPAIEAFGWDGASGQRGQSPAVAAILQRIDDWRTIETLTGRDDADRGAFLSLSRPPRANWRMRLDALRPGTAQRIRTLLEYSQWQMPGLRHSFNPQTLAWWEDHFSRARMTLGRLALAPAALMVMFALIALFRPPPPWDLIAFAVGGPAALALPLLHLRTIGRFVHARETGVAPALPRWVETGWVVPLFALPIAAMFVPPSPAWAVTLLIAGVLATQWTQAVAGGRRRPGVNNAFTLVLTIGFYAFFSLIVFFDLPLATQIVLVTVAAVVIHARMVAVDALRAIGEPLTARFYVPGFAIIGALTALAIRSPLEPIFIAAWSGVVSGLLANAMFHGAMPVAHWLIRIGIGVAFLAAAVISIPEGPGSTGIAGGATYAPVAPPISGQSTDIAMQRLDADQPVFALMRTNNPALYGELRAIVDRHITGGLDQAQAGRRFDDKLNAAHRQMLASAPDDLLEQGLKLEMARRRLLQLKNPAACAGTGDIQPGDLPEPLTRAGLTHTIQIVSVAKADRVSGSTGKPVPDALVLETAAKRLGIGTRELSRRLSDEAPDADRCAARIEMLHAVLDEPLADIAATVRETAANPS